MIHNYTPAQHPVRAWQSEMKRAAIEALRGESLLEGPIWLNVAFHMPRPKRLCRKNDSAGPIPCASKPDLTNLVKAVEDGLNGIVWRDDAQVHCVSAGKWYTEKDGITQTIIAVMEVSA